MNKEITVQHPSSARPVRARSFVAYGEAVGISDVRAVLRDSTRRLITEGRTLQRPPHWIVYFPSLDVLPGDYALEVSEVGVNIPLCEVQPLTLTGPAHPGIHVDYPSEGEVVLGTQLVAYGTTDQNLRVKGTLTLRRATGAPEVFVAEQVFGPPESPHWVIAFTGLPADRGTLHLELRNSSGATAAREGLRLEGASG
jgi:hypothetical protein